jgi:hypothetical protein
MPEDPLVSLRSSPQGPVSVEGTQQLRVTPELIRSSIAPARLAQLTKHVEFSMAPQTPDVTTQCVRMMALLRPEELRTVARALNVAEEGRFIDIFRRLTERC